MKGISLFTFFCVVTISFSLTCGLSLVSAETLEEAWSIALSRDHRIQASRLNADSTRQLVSAAKASRLPALSLESGFTVLDNAPASILNIPMSTVDRIPTGEDKSVSYKATVALPLYTGGRIKAGIDAAASAWNAALQEERKTIQDVKLSVAEAYIAVLRAGRMAEVAEMNVTSLASYARDVEQFFEQGMVTKNDLLAAQVSLADARQRLTQAANALAVARAAYNRLLGRALDQPVALDDLSAEAVDTDLETLKSKALEKRPELVSLSEQSRALKNQASGARASSLPHLALSGGYSFTQNKYQVHEDVWAAHIGLRWDIFDGGVSRHNAAALRQRADALDAMRRDTVSLVALEVHQTCLDADEAFKRIAVTREAVSQSEENLRVAKDRYREGVGTHTEVLEAETLRTKSYTNYHNAIYDAVMAQIRLKYVTGDL